jgi:hypothetical protein
MQDYLPTAPQASKHNKGDPGRRNTRPQTRAARDLEKIHTNCATLARSCAFVRVSLERREHHGSYEVTVAGPFPSQSSIRSGFCGPTVFRAKAPARTPCSGSFSKGSRAKTHVRAKPQPADLARLVRPRLAIPSSFTDKGGLMMSEVAVTLGSLRG